MAQLVVGIDPHKRSGDRGGGRPGRGGGGLGEFRQPRPRDRRLAGLNHAEAVLAALPLTCADTLPGGKKVWPRLTALVAACGSTLLDEHGIGVVGAAALLVGGGDPTRFRSEAAFNRWWGGAPVAVSSGEGHQQNTLNDQATSS